MRKSLPLYEFTLLKTLSSQRQGNNFKNFLFQEQNTGENRKNYKDHKLKKKIEQFFKPDTTLWPRNAIDGCLRSLCIGVKAQLIVLSFKFGVNRLAKELDLPELEC